MRFLIDANLPRSLAALVASLGYEVEFARDVGLAAAPDSEVAARAQATLAALVTRDLDFTDVRRYPIRQIRALTLVGSNFSSRVPTDGRTHSAMATQFCFSGVGQRPGPLPP